KPIHDLPVEEGRSMGAPAEIGSLNRGDEIAERAGEVACAHVPGPETRMDVAHRVGHDVGGDFAPDVGERLRMAGERRFESRKDVAGHLSPDRALANVAQIADGVVQNQVRDGKGLVPILRIKAFGASLRFGVVPIEGRHGGGYCADGVDRESASSSWLISASMPSKSGADR